MAAVLQFITLMAQTVVCRNLASALVLLKVIRVKLIDPNGLSQQHNQLQSIMD